MYKIFVLAFFTLLLIPFGVRADVGPKPSLNFSFQRDGVPLEEDMVVCLPQMFLGGEDLNETAGYVTATTNLEAMGQTCVICPNGSCTFYFYDLDDLAFTFVDPETFQIFNAATQNFSSRESQITVSLKNEGSAVITAKQPERNNVYIWYLIAGAVIVGLAVFWAIKRSAKATVENNHAT